MKEMQRVKVLNKKKAPNFIGAWMLKDNDLCEQLINFFDDHPDQHNAGATGEGVNTSIKKTTDMSVAPKLLEQEEYKVFKTYMEELRACYYDYMEQWPFLKLIQNVEIGRFNVQKYASGDHFSAVHTERDGAANMHRILAFMTYLNDVDGGGETSFPHYELSIKPERGKTIIWPAEWTHAHSGGLVRKGHKYIVTGWIQFV